MSIDSIINSNIRICQPDNGFRFGIDSVVLAWFAKLKKNDTVIDIGSGSGVLSILLASLKNAKTITAIELQQDMYACLTQSIELNDLSKNITAIHGDIKQFKPTEKFNLAICNPPYRPQNIGKISNDAINMNARFDFSMNLNDILTFCKKNIYYNGRLVLTGDADRLVDMLCTCRNFNFEPKRLMFLYPEQNKRPKIFFLECVYGGGVELIVEPPVIQDSENALYTSILQGFWSNV